jgi:hypothetical protein
MTRMSFRQSKQLVSKNAAPAGRFASDLTGDGDAALHNAPAFFVHCTNFP